MDDREQKFHIKCEWKQTPSDIWICPLEEFLLHGCFEFYCCNSCSIIGLEIYNENWMKHFGLCKRIEMDSALSWPACNASTRETRAKMWHPGM